MSPRPATRAWSRVALAGLSLAFLLIYVFVGDRTWWGEWISIWPPIGWLVLLLPVMLRLRSWAALSLLVVLVVSHSHWRFGGGEEAASGPTLRYPRDGWDRGPSRT